MQWPRWRWLSRATRNVAGRLEQSLRQRAAEIEEEARQDNPVVWVRGRVWHLAADPEGFETLCGVEIGGDPLILRAHDEPPPHALWCPVCIEVVEDVED